MEQNEKGFRKGMKNKVLDKIRDSLTDEEARRIEEIRKFADIKKDSFSYKLALYLDELRKQLRQRKMLITKRLWNMVNLKNNVYRLDEQLRTRQIYEKLNDTTVMNVEELKTNIQYKKWTIEGEVQSIAGILGEIRGLVNHKDIMGDVILNEEEFDKYSQEVCKKIEELGCNLFS